MYLVANHENGPMRMIWSFFSGLPIYSSYQAPINKGRGKGKENASAVPVSGFMECGDDWSLYMHDEHYGKMVFILIYICYNIVIGVFMAFSQWFKDNYHEFNCYIRKLPLFLIECG